MNTAWMSAATCPDRLDLPWLVDSDDLSTWERLTMAAICTDCPTIAACTAFVSVEDVTGGFWAGCHRDHPAAAPVPVASRPVWAVQPELPGFGDAA
jgi:hypothetical protein